MYVWVDTSELSGELLKAAQSTHIQKWLEKMSHAFKPQSPTVQALFKLREVADQNGDVWDALLALSKFDGYEDKIPESGTQTCMKENKPEGIWEKPTGEKAKRWAPGMKKTPALF